MVKDRFHDVVRTALEKEGWKITADPYEVNVDDVDFELELVAEQLLAAELEDRKIAVEVKSFLTPSDVSEFHTALGHELHRAIIDPACGSGHFLLGSFHRLLDRWLRKEPGRRCRNWCSDRF